MCYNNYYRYKHPSIKCLSNHSSSTINTNRSSSSSSPLITIHHHVWEVDEFQQQNEYRHEQGMNRCFRKELPDRYDYTPDTPSLLDIWGLYLHINQLVVLHQHQCIQGLVTSPSASSAVAVVLYLAEFTAARSNNNYQGNNNNNYNNNKHHADIIDATATHAAATIPADTHAAAAIITNDTHSSPSPSSPEQLMLPPEMQIYRKNHSM